MQRKQLSEFPNATKYERRLILTNATNGILTLEINSLKKFQPNTNNIKEKIQVALVSKKNKKQINSSAIKSHFMFSADI